MQNCSPLDYSSLHAFTDGYDIIHIPLSLAICVCGVIGNIVNVIVLSQPGMRSSTNLLMSALSAGEGTVMSIYIFYVSMYRIDRKLEQGMTRPYALTLFIMVYTQNLFHAFSSWMIVFVTAFRLAFMRAGVSALYTCSYVRARLIIFIDVVLALLLSAPFLFAHHVEVDPDNSINGTDAYKLDFVSNYALTTLLLVTTGLFMKVLPIVLSTVFTVLLVRTLLNSQKRHDRLQKEATDKVLQFLANQKEPSNGSNASISLRRSTLKRPNDHDSNSRNIHQTTNIMIALTILYITTYLPQVRLPLFSIFLANCQSFFHAKRNA